MARKRQFRRRLNSPTWHWCTNCRHFPKDDYETTTKPPLTNLCMSCTNKEKSGTCKSI